MATNIDKETVQGMIIKHRQLQLQAESYTQQIGVIQASLEEHEKALTTMKALENIEEGGELLVSIGAGTAIYATLDRKDKVIVSFGGGVSAEKDLKSAIDIVTKRQKDLLETQKRLAEAVSGVEAEIQKLEQNLQVVAAQMEHKG
ncbi:MAG: prefoldin, alpha subunit [Candidatus Syntrophoarchaeum caldarius]|uniref:Prefoldin subunit alpha n=1 Tax=Candidatus Syntropharchaeum caldarium TaxID=1838285 RepID=A0A1F2P9F1_9EURY|nr:MAG: prefoldin, alpha subunit [Candidatus Syntrophoarchaeum caldarius]